MTYRTCEKNLEMTEAWERLGQPKQRSAKASGCQGGGPGRQRGFRLGLWWLQTACGESLCSCHYHSPFQWLQDIYGQSLDPEEGTKMGKGHGRRERGPWGRDLEQMAQVGCSQGQFRPQCCYFSTSATALGESQNSWNLFLESLFLFELGRIQL